MLPARAAATLPTHDSQRVQVCVRRGAQRDADAIAERVRRDFARLTNVPALFVFDRRGREVYRHRSYGPGDWFGEVSAHSHHPALATYRASEPSTVALLEARLFSKLQSGLEIRYIEPIILSQIKLKSMGV